MEDLDSMFHSILSCCFSVALTRSALILSPRANGKANQTSQTWDIDRIMYASWTLAATNCGLSET